MNFWGYLQCKGKVCCRHARHCNRSLGQVRCCEVLRCTICYGNRDFSVQCVVVLVDAPSVTEHDTSFVLQCLRLPCIWSDKGLYDATFQDRVCWVTIDGTLHSPNWLTLHGSVLHNFLPFFTTQITRKQNVNIKNQVSCFKPLASWHAFELSFSNFARNAGCPVVFRDFIRENILSETNLEMISFLHFLTKPLNADHFFTPQQAYFGFSLWESFESRRVHGCLSVVSVVC